MVNSLKNAPSYAKFKKWVQDQGITSNSEFNLAKSKLPSGYPKDPTYFYKKQGTWKGFSDLFGRESHYLTNAPSYDEFKKWVQDHGIINRDEFNLAKSKFPPGYPKDPPSFYGQRGTWKGWYDFCGKEPFYLDNAPSYEEFKKWVQDQGIKNQKEFRRLDKIKFPPGYSKRPDYYYKKQGTWKGWNDLCGTEQYFLLTAPSYEEYKKWLQDQGIKTQSEFRKFDKSKFPPGYPKEPGKFYKKEYKGLGDMLGTGTVATQNLEWLSPKEARISIRKIAKDVFGGKPFTQRDWINAHKAGEIPASLPRYLDTIYDPNVRKRRKIQDLAHKERKRKKK